MNPYALALILALGAAAPALAANADAPHTNVDKSNDAGNGTGNNKVDALNRGQLDANQRPAGTAPMAPAAPAAASSTAQPAAPAQRK